MGMIENAEEFVVATQNYVNGVGTVVYDPALIDLAKTEFTCFTVLIIAFVIIFFVCTVLHALVMLT